MAIDVSQFLETFYEESFEGLDIMESSLLNLNVGEVDDETINTIFRAAHSIKGGSGTFGLAAVAEFTHVLETLLDEMRSGKREVTKPAVDLMLTSVDVLREMLIALRGSQAVDSERVAEVHNALETMLRGEAEQSAVSPETVVESGDVATGGEWLINFKPHVHLFKTGNDPVRILRELAELGELEVTADLSELPAFEDMDPEECYTRWQIHYRGDAGEAAIKDVFAWVEDDCDLVIEAVSPAEVAAPVESVEQAVPVVAEVPKEKVAEVAAPVAAKASAPKRAAGSEAGSIRVSIDKVDALINMVGELVITQSMLNQLGEEFSMDKLQRLQEGLAELERHTRELQENVMRIRMLPISFAFNRFPRLVHDLSSKLNKRVELKLSGEQTELDKTVMEKIGDPLVHLVRNSLDHGIEAPGIRAEKGKPETGTLELNAYHQGGNIVIEIIDDGAGLNTDRIRTKAIEKGLIGADENLPDEKIHELIFHPGFSTAETVSDVSGRGVGMDVVKRNIKDLGGSIEVTSEKDKGSTFAIRLPLTLAILDGQLIRIGDQTFVLPLVNIIESVQIKEEFVNSIAGETELYELRDEYVPVVRVHEMFNIEPESHDLIGNLLVVVEGDGQYVGLLVDELLGQQQVVIKSLESNFKRVEGVSGATILGDGTVALIIDIPGLVTLTKNNSGGGKRRVIDKSKAA